MQVSRIVERSGIDQEARLEFINAFAKLLALLVHHISQHGVLEVAKDMQRAVLDCAVLSLTHEARQQLTKPLHSVYDVVHLMQLGFEVFAELHVQSMKLLHEPTKNL